MLKIQFLFIKTHFFENYEISFISGHPVPYIVIEDTSSIHLTNDTLSCLSKKRKKKECNVCIDLKVRKEHTAPIQFCVQKSHFWVFNFAQKCK